MWAVTEWEWNPDTYLAEMAAEIPGYEELQEAVAAATATVHAARVLELGTGTGETALRVWAGQPDSQWIGIDARTIAELSMQLEILKAIYARAIDLFQRGRKDEGLRYGLRIQGYGDWNLDNVYAFVYERSVELEPHAHHAFVGGIRAADFALMLNS